MRPRGHYYSRGCWTFAAPILSACVRGGGLMLYIGLSHFCYLQTQRPAPAFIATRALFHFRGTAALSLLCYHYYYSPSGCSNDDVGSLAGAWRYFPCKFHNNIYAGFFDEGQRRIFDRIHTHTCAKLYLGGGGGGCVCFNN